MSPVCGEEYEKEEEKKRVKMGKGKKKEERRYITGTEVRSEE
jgi:hypothetical protein